MSDRSRLLALALGAALLASPRPASAQSSLCPYGYTVGFFNGVGNTYVDGLSGMHALQDAIREEQGSQADVQDSEDVSYQLYYNQTKSTLGVPLQDFAEVFVQRANEIDHTGGVGTAYLYLFWEAQQHNHFGALARSTVFGSFFADFVTALKAQVLTDIAYMAANPPTEQDYAIQDAALGVEAAAGRKLVLIAHSQGNLFVNHAYDFIHPAVGDGRIRVVHEAPASITLRGDYLLSSLDLVINGLRPLTGFETIAANNVALPLTSGEPLGHGLIPVYLNASVGAARARSQQLFSAAFQGMGVQQCTLTMKAGNSSPDPGEEVTLTATLAPPLSAHALTAPLFKWAITGAAGGYFVNPLTGNSVSSLWTTAPAATYHAPASAAADATDTVTVEVDVSTPNNNSVTSKALAVGSISLTVKGCGASGQSCCDPGGTGGGTCSGGLTCKDAVCHVPPTIFHDWYMVNDASWTCQDDSIHNPNYAPEWKYIYLHGAQYGTNTVTVADRYSDTCTFSANLEGTPDSGTLSLTQCIQCRGISCPPVPEVFSYLTFWDDVSAVNALSLSSAQCGTEYFWFTL